MDIKKKLLVGFFITGGVLLCMPFCSSCSSGDAGKESTYANKEYIDSLNKTINIYSSSTQEQRETLFRIMKELDEIADEAFALGKERQFNGKVKDMRMVDQVKFKLATIQTELNQAREKAMNNPELCATIDNLKRQITEQESYINHLRSTIQIKKGKLQTQLTELEKTKDSLENSKLACENSNARILDEQARLDYIIRNSWMSVGNKLVASAEQVQLVKKHGKLVGQTKEAKKHILRRAIECYNMAAELGETSASQKISQVEMQIRNLNNN